MLRGVLGRNIQSVKMMSLVNGRIDVSFSEVRLQKKNLVGRPQVISPSAPALPVTLSRLAKHVGRTYDSSAENRRSIYDRSFRSLSRVFHRVYSRAGEASFSGNTFRKCTTLPAYTGERDRTAEETLFV